MKVLGAVLVGLFALVVTVASVLKHPAYTPDGIVYARFAARDAGYSERVATLAARSFYDRTAMMSNARYRALIELDPSISFARSKVFENRVLYPWIVGMLLSAAGFRALFLVNATAYVAFGLALYWMLLGFRRPAFALVISIVALCLPVVRDAAASDLTDMTAMLWWALALGALLRAAQRSGPQALAVLAVSSALLALTRPTPYLVVLPAIALGLVRGIWTPFAATFTGVASFLAVAVATHAYGISEQLHWVYDHRPAATDVSFGAWYRASLFSSVRFVIAESIRTVIPALMVIAAVYGLWHKRTRPEMAVLTAAGIACLIAVPFNPVPSSFARVVMLPLVPVFCAIAQCTIEAVLQKTVQAPAEAPATEAVAS
jgi:4-amino-4-deoxy-L-arabinose transferase-like glycosyltransferase